MKSSSSFGELENASKPTRASVVLMAGLSMIGRKVIVEFRHDLRRGMGGCDDASPGIHVEALDPCLVHGGQPGNSELR